MSREEKIAYLIELFSMLSDEEQEEIIALTASTESEK